MTTAAEHSEITIALIGNPNTGKSTLFSLLAGVWQRVGNFPGVTVEKKIGQMRHAGARFQLIDLPGTYSLAPRSIDEMVAVDVLLGSQVEVEAPQGVICIVDASNLERNLYLVSQVLEMGLPTVVALNMTDVAAQRGITIDSSTLSSRLGVPVVPIQANRAKGIEQLKEALCEVLQTDCVESESCFPAAFCQEVDHFSQLFNPSGNGENGGKFPRYLIERLLLDTSGYIETFLRHQAGNPTQEGDAIPADISQRLTDARHRLSEVGCPVPAVEAMARYAWVEQILQGVVDRAGNVPERLSDKIDHVLTHRIWGTLFFALTMALVFSSIFVAADPIMGMIDEAVGALATQVELLLPPGAFRSLLVSGVIGGVGAVVIFLPQILILFFFIGVLEDCGYMARAAYLMDKLMVRVGLSGKSFIPMLSSFACAIPGIMSARVIENRRDRITTILVAPLMSCSARLPVYTVLIGAFIPTTTLLGSWLPGLTLFAMYMVGIVTAVIVALLLKRTILRGETPPFVMELPPYKWPSPTLVVHRMLERGWSFVRRAGTLVFSVSVIIWFLSYYPHDEKAALADIQLQQQQLTQKIEAMAPDDSAHARMQAQLALLETPEGIEHRVASAMQRQSMLGRMGQFIEPAVSPLGWDWRIGCAVIASFPAREVVIGVLGVLYDLGDLDVGDLEAQSDLQAKLRSAKWDGTDRKVYTIPVALSIMVFFALCAQCVATLAVMRRETNSWRWPAFMFVYMTTLAYLGAFVTYQLGTFLEG